MDYINLGFGGLAKGEETMANYIASIENMSAFVMDYDHNAPTPEHLLETHERMYKIVRKAHPSIPIIMISCPRVKMNDNWTRRRDIIKKTYENALENGDTNVSFIDGSHIFDEIGNDYSIDGTHPTDLGFLFMAKAIAPVLREVLKNTNND